MGNYTDSMEYMDAWEEMIDDFHGQSKETSTAELLDHIDDGVDINEELRFAWLMEE